MRNWRRMLAVMLVMLFAAVVIDKALLCPYWYSHWGTTVEEQRMQWPGDELVKQPGRCMRAVTIHAPAEAIWPWILQIGQDRGGFYSYTWLENLLLADMRNADRIFPEFQSRNLGDIVWMAPRHRYSGKAYMVVGKLVPYQAMVLVQRDDFEAMKRGERVRGGIWQFLLLPIDQNNTRLIMRGTVPDKTSIVYDLLFDPAHFIMERKMMLGIKERVEHQGRQQL